VVREFGVVVFTVGVTRTDVHGDCVELRYFVQQPMLSVVGDRLGLDHAQSRVDHDAGLAADPVPRSSATADRPRHPRREWYEASLRQSSTIAGSTASIRRR
jgi:hypothetical protein